jgi:3-hydroxyisobutyrate dehydrogenase-like beta-hydroxyacid dehydrogenase
MAEKMRVGLIGAGLMGHGIGKNIVQKGYPLTVMAHRNRASIDDLVSKGAKEAKSPAAVAEGSDLVILCVTGTPQVEAIVYGDNGLLASSRKGLIIADCSTAEPLSTLKIAAETAAKGIHFVDTPMTRTPKEAEDGKLGLMIAGDKNVLDKIRPVLECFADTIVFAGDVGAAHKLKLLNNFLSMGHAALAAEAIMVAAKANVDMKAFRDIVMSGGAASVMFDRLIKVPLADDDSAAKFAIRNGRKDMRYYTNLTEQLPATSFLAEAVHQTFVMADNLGYGDRFVPRLIDMFCQVNGVKKA